MASDPHPARVTPVAAGEIEADDVSNHWDNLSGIDLDTEEEEAFCSPMYSSSEYFLRCF